MQPVSLKESLVNELSLKGGRGLMVANVETDAPADTAGIILGDILVAIEDTPLSRLRDVQAYLEPQSVGKTLKIQLIRAGKLMDISLTVGDSRK